MWNVRTITSVMRVYAPGIAQIFDRIFPAFYTEKENETIKKLFPTCESISIDYAVMEKAEAIYVLPASFGWSDLGTWGALRGLLPQDKSGNATVCTKVKIVLCMPAKKNELSFKDWMDISSRRKIIHY